ncbi:MAG: PAS domain S-box protein, partial [Deltaproteobacteria bacterium]
MSAHICVIDEQGTIITTNKAWDNFAANNGADKVKCGAGTNYLAICQPALESDSSAKEFIAGISAVINGTLPEFIIDYPCHSPEAEQWFSCKVNPFRVADVTYAVLSHENITWRKEAENRMRKLSRAIEQCPVTIMITDTEGTIEFVNPHFTEMSGYTAAEAIGQTPRLLHSGFTAPEKFKDLWDTIKAGKSWSGEFINRCKDGNVRVEQAQISPLRDEQGIITHYMGIKEDITARKEMEASLLVAKEKAEAANHAKDEFLAVMSHEMRTPMNGVIGMSRMLLESGLSPEQQEYAEIICTCGENLLAIVDDVLSFTRIKGGTQKLELNDFELHSVLEQTTTMFARQIEHTALNLSCRIDPEIPSVLKGDVRRLRQIIANLVSNAIKFTSKGSVI